MSKDLPPSRTAEQFVVRFPDGMRDRIKSMADEDGRSMNSQIIYMLQDCFDQMEDRVEQLQDGLKSAGRSNVSIGLNDPVDRAAILKVILLNELMLLRRRISALGGPDAVLELKRSEIAERIEGEKISGTAEEQTTLFSQLLPAYPLSALLTDGEISKLAGRVVELQKNQPSAPTKSPK